MLAPALLLFLASAFVLPNQSAYALVFYLAGLPTALAALARRRPAPTPELLLAAALIGFSAATLLWGVDDGHRSARFAWDSANTLIFVLAMALAWAAPAARARLASVLVAAGAANAAFSLALSFLHPAIGPRLHGWGATRHPILGALVMGVPYLTALHRGLAGTARPRLHLGAALLMALFILFTESRGPLLAAGTATLFLCAAGPWRGQALAALAALAVLWEALPRAVQHHAEGVIIARGSSHRFEIWRHTLHVILERPIFGHGLADNLHLDVLDPGAVEHITFPHGLYVSLLFYSGAVGLALFAALAAALARRVWAWRGEAEATWLTALGINALLGGLTDLGQITKGPGPLWFILWLPAGLVIARAGAEAGVLAGPRIIPPAQDGDAR